VRRVALASEQIALVPGGTFGPYFGDRPEGMVAAWAEEAGGKRRWMTVGIGDDAAPRAEPKAVAEAAMEVDLVALRALASGAGKGFLLLTSSREFSGERVDAFALGLRGELAGGPSPLAQSLGDVVWVDAVPTDAGAIAMWAIRHDDRADLFGVEVGAAGQVKDTPTELVTGARAWQVAPMAGGVAIAVLAAGKTRAESGPLRVLFVDSAGHLEKKSLVVGDGATAEPDLDLARIGDHYVLAWSDRREVEPRLYGAVMDGAGSLVKPPAPLGRPFGSQAVLRIVPPARAGGPAFLAWENLVERRPGGRALRLAGLSADGVLGEASALVFMAADDAIPELGGTAKGVAALTLAPACKRGESCPSERAVPTFVELDAALDVVASEPVRLDALGGEAVDLAWGLTCQHLECTALAASPASPAPVFAVKLGGISTAWEPAARRVTDSPAPRASQMVLLGKSEAVAELAVAPVGAGIVLSSVTYFDPATPFVKSRTIAPDGKYEPPRAVLRVQILPEHGKAPEPAVLSYRAHSPGGVAVSPGDPARGDVAVGWVGVDNKEPQVFVTLLGPDGKKQSQKMLTHAKGGVSDVALAFTGDGWVVAWVDERGGASEVHLAKVDRALKPLAAERRIGATASTATSVQLVLRGEHVFAVWSEARGPSDGVADVFAARFLAKDLSPVGPEHVVAETPAHSRSPVAAAFGDGAVVAWIEDSPRGRERAPTALMLARLDSGAEPVAGSIATVTLAGAPEGVGIACAAAACRVAASVSVGGRGGVDAFEWRPGAELRPTRLVNLGAPPRDALSPVVVGSEVFYADEARPGDVRIRRLGVDWE
jgi:hypothetical protein